jgi:hypothetical protein
MCEREFSSMPSILDSVLKTVAREVETLNFNIAFQDKLSCARMEFVERKEKT